MFTHVLVAAFALTAPVPKPLAPMVGWRLAKGDSFYVTYEYDSSTDPVGQGLFSASVTAARLVSKLTVVAADNKSTTLEMEIVSFASGRGNAGNTPLELSDRSKAVGLKMTFKLDQTLKVSDVEADLGLYTAEGLFATGLLDPTHQADVLTEYLHAVPGKRLGKGDTWKAEREVLNYDDFKQTRSERGMVSDVAEDRITLTVECDRRTAAEGLRAYVFDQKSENGKRTVVFDPKACWVRKLTDEYTTEGEVGTRGGQIFKTTSKTKSTVTVTDEKPKGGK